MHEVNWRIIKPSQDELDARYKFMLRHSKREKACKICGSHFKHGNQNSMLCGCCKIISVCPVCDKEFEVVLDRYSGKAQKNIVNSILNNENLDVMCSKSCSNMSRKSFGECPHCGKENVHIYNGRCEHCANHELNGPIECKVHGHQNRSFGGVCIICHNQSEKMIQQAAQQGKMNRHEEFCKKCNMVTPHYGYRCLECDPVEFQGAKPKFLHKDGMRFFLDPKSNEYVPWNEYRDEFIASVSMRHKNDFDGFVAIPTFRTQECVDWSGGAKKAFEQYLVDAGIKWFAYVKFYIDESGKSIPLVAGKSGSQLVNACGSDLDFGEWDGLDENGVNFTPARVLLHEKGLHWDKTKIAIYQAESESEALQMESYILNKYHLLPS